MAVDKKTQQVNEMGPEFMRNLADNAKHNLIRDFIEEHIKPAATSGKYSAIIELYDADDEDEVNTREMIEGKLPRC